ncbi:hypothetical protein [Litorisediminicola beolgyonensis]|uniref:Uncharacterized protein n=1 Tax=Litorisediminicola beolgyonensis TaxID=1173614 RepID=A0ABW3ZKR2_9RHOB
MLANENYTIYPHKDGTRKVRPWIIEDYDERGAFDAEQLDELMERFGFSEEDARGLSICVGNCLDSESEVCMIPVSRDKAVEAGCKLLRDALRQMGSNEEKLAKVIEALETVDNLFASEEDPGHLEATRAMAHDPGVSCKELRDAIKKLNETYGAVALIAPDDARRVTDQRTRRVADQCFYTWRDAGRALTFTTRPDEIGDPRTGKLIEFVQWVGRQLTNPSVTLSGHTIYEDIKRFKAKEAREAERRAERLKLGLIQRDDGTMQERTELDMPPIFGNPAKEDA